MAAETSNHEITIDIWKWKLAECFFDMTDKAKSSHLFLYNITDNLVINIELLFKTCKCRKSMSA